MANARVSSCNAIAAPKVARTVFASYSVSSAIVSPPEYDPSSLGKRHKCDGRKVSKLSRHDDGNGSTETESSLGSTGNTLRELAGLDGPQSSSDSDDLTGTVFGRFRILSVLGRGGMGVVYLAVDAALAREVALKVLSLDVAEDPEHRQRLLREARASAALSHPNIAAVYEMGEVDGRLYIAMERIEGESLKTRLEHGPLPQSEALDIAKQILHGIAKAHAAGIVHRDIKPDNIMVSAGGTVKVLDFGIAKFLAEGHEPSGLGTTATAHGRLLGTPSYMSPEQANALPVDTRSDVFSFGIVLYEMSTGKTPFGGKNFLDVLAALARDEPLPPSQLNPDVRPDLERIILRCLRKDPAERHAHAGAILEELDLLQPHSSKSEPLKPLRRTQRFPLIVFSVAVVAVMAGAWVWRGTKSSRAPTSTPVVSSTIGDAMASAAPAGTPITGHPPPNSQNEAAIAAYREGLQGLRDGAYIVAHAAFSKAVELDSTLGAAYVRLVITGIWHSPTPEDVRRSYRKAISHRTTLAERDRLILEALEPVVQRDPPDAEEAAKRLRQASEQFPGDAELLAMRSLAPFAPNLSPAEELELSDRCVAIDPQYADCWQPRASALARLGRVDEAEAATKHCLEVSPAANDCIADRMEIHAGLGHCESMAEDARRIIANDANDWSTHRALATALLAQGRPTTTVRAALEQGWNKTPAETQQRWRRFDEIHFAQLEGRLEDAERAILAWIPEEDKNPFDKVHRDIARDLVILYETLGKTNEAGKIADGYLSRREVWLKGFVRSIWHDPTLWFLKRKVQAGFISPEAFAADRKAWVEAWEKRVALDMKPIVWLAAYVLPVMTAEDAKEALSLAPQLKSLTYYIKQPTELHSALGRMYLLAGRYAEAITHSSQAASDCRILYRPLENTLDHYYLGQAREHSSDKQGACNAYRVVLERWGKAHALIHVVEDTRLRVRKLECKSQ